MGNDNIVKSVDVNISAANAFKSFTHAFGSWWPKEFTWSQELLQQVSLGRKPGDRCTETGPNGFRCDWGTITELERDNHIAFAWQISFTRVPVPDKTKASNVRVTFHAKSPTSTNIILEHKDFKNHGNGYEAYFEAMNSAQGWEYILQCYKTFAENNSTNTSKQ